MRFSSFILALVTAIFPVAESRADNCQFTFKCQGNICERALPASCSGSTPVANVVVNSPPLHAANVDLSATGSNPNNAAVLQPEKSSDSSTLSPPSPIGPGCAENGSCFGDVSNINGMPKTTHINGYFRRDGTYVRGHYRSSGRR